MGTPVQDCMVKFVPLNISGMQKQLGLERLLLSKISDYMVHLKERPHTLSQKKILLPGYLGFIVYLEQVILSSMFDKACPTIPAVHCLIKKSAELIYA